MHTAPWPVMGTLVVLLTAGCATVNAPPRAQTTPPPTAQATPAPPSPEATSTHHIDGRQARLLVERGARLVDVRTPEEYAAGHIEGAVLIPVDQIDKRAAEIGPPTTPAVIYCRTGRRTHAAAETLRHKGYTQVYELGPMEAWNAKAAP